jgi:hypothetical protein
MCGLATHKAMERNTHITHPTGCIYTPISTTARLRRWLTQVTVWKSRI